MSHEILDEFNTIILSSFNIDKFIIEKFVLTFSPTLIFAVCCLGMFRLLRVAPQ